MSDAVPECAQVVELGTLRREPILGAIDEVLEDLGVCGSQVIEALLGQPLEQCRGGGLIGQPKHDSGVPPAVADGHFT